MRKIHLTSLPGLLALALVLTGSAGAQSALQTAQPTRGDIIRYVTLPGAIKPNQQVTLYARIPGYLKSIKVDKGDFVKAGDVIATIDVPELEAELARQKAELTRAKALGTQAAAEVKAANIDLKRLSEALKKSPDLVTPQSVDLAEAAVEIAKARQTVAAAEQEVANAHIKRTETLLGFAKITAPFSGVVTARFVDDGAFIPAATSGSSAQTAALVTIMDFSTVRAQVPMMELEASLVAKGQPVKITVEGLAGKVFDGQVSRISYALNEASKTMLVEADIPNPQHELRPGMYAIVRLGVEKRTAALLVPSDGLVTERAGTSVFAYVDGKAKKTPVKIGFNDGSKVEIVSGVAPEDRVLLVGKTALTDGQLVNVTEAK